MELEEFAREDSEVDNLIALLPIWTKLPKLTSLSETHRRTFQNFTDTSNSFIEITSTAIPSNLDQFLQNGSASFERKGHISLSAAILPHASCVAQDHPRASRRPDLQARQEGCNSIPDRCCPQRFARYRSSQGCHWYVWIQFRWLCCVVEDDTDCDLQVTRFSESSSQMVLFLRHEPSYDHHWT